MKEMIKQKFTLFFPDFFFSGEEILTSFSAFVIMGIAVLESTTHSLRNNIAPLQAANTRIN